MQNSINIYSVLFNFLLYNFLLYIYFIIFKNAIEFKVSARSMMMIRKKCLRKHNDIELYACSQQYVLMQRQMFCWCICSFTFDSI